jgi:hypothetical protein
VPVKTTELKPARTDVVTEVPPVVVVGAGVVVVGVAGVVTGVTPRSRMTAAPAVPR